MALTGKGRWPPGAVTTVSYALNVEAHFRDYHGRALALPPVFVLVLHHAIPVKLPCLVAYSHPEI